MNENVYEQAIKYLSIRLHTTGELQRKLKMKGFNDTEILPVLRRLEDLKFLDDKKFAEIFVDNLKRYKDFGYFIIRAKLQLRKIPDDIASAALNEFYTAEDEIAVAKRVAAKLQRQNKTREKLVRSLESKGFRTGTIYKAISEN